MGVAQGNVPLALLITVLTSLLGIFVMPVSLEMLLQASMAIEIDAKVMIEELCLTLLLPACVGMLLRRFPAVDAFYASYKQGLGMSSAVALSSIPFLKIGSSH